jgi:hypothetical protein
MLHNFSDKNCLWSTYRIIENKGNGIFPVVIFDKKNEIK